ncbi:histidine phosphatase family protein [Streptomyces sp. CA-210063]|uniref:histidine phosphatase family protein n=1 Tax=Streptomyces sp. CA-210063 TaxID=2801029 RepID=UPI00214BAEF3|nr:histidine phosphatase family protein [Streptomyces sp. CA-210063]UUU33245.1 histidine phosphatase family protein [Streptomyces sp. CA-210063]
MRLLLTRHGQTTSNLTHALDTDAPGAELTTLGRQQAEELVGRLANEPIDALYVSTLRRARQTAAPLARERGLRPVVREGLRELSAGDLEMNRDAESVQLYLKTVMAWASGQTDLRMPGGETGEEALTRYDEVIEEIAGSGADGAAVVSHGAAIRTWAAARSRNVDAAYAARHPLENTHIVAMDGDPRRGWTVTHWGGQPVG